MSNQSRTVNHRLIYPDYFSSATQTQSRLRTYFGRVEEGSDWIGRTNFGGKDTPEVQILDAWAEHLEALRNQWPTLLEFEEDLRKKVGPMSVMLPLEQRIPDVESYYESILLDTEPLEDAAVGAVINEWSAIRGLRMRNQIHTVGSMRLSTSSGSPYFLKRKQVVTRTMPVNCVIDGDTVFMQQGDMLWKAAAILGWRGQEGGPSVADVKQRVVWMFPFGVNICELQVYQPLIAAAQTAKLVPAWIGMDEVDRKVTQLFDTKGKTDLVMCTDFTAFDQHFNIACQSASEDILQALTAPSLDVADWFSNVYPIKYMIPIALSSENMWYGHHGMASGSGGTNVDETILHRCLQHEAALEQGTQLNTNSMCLGDDGIVSFPSLDPARLIESYTRHGLAMNESKQTVSTDECTYLRRWHHKSYRVDGVCVGVYSTFRALGRLMHQERYYSDWNAKMVALRQLSIIENVKYHPLREQFADFCMERDMYRLGLDIPGFLANINVEAKEAMDYIPDFLGYTKAQAVGVDFERNPGLDSWWIVNYLKSKA